MTEPLPDVNQLPSKDVDGLLADMRSKYVHAKSEEKLRETLPSWLKGEPITSNILERWIPVVERIQRTLQGISTCSTCEACRGAATRALTQPPGVGQ